MAKDGYEYDDRDRGYPQNDYDYEPHGYEPQGGGRGQGSRQGSGGGRRGGRNDDTGGDDAPSLTESPAAEREVIGNVLVQPDTMRYAHGLAPEDFTVENHRTIWRAFVRIVEQDRDITTRAVTSICPAADASWSRVWLIVPAPRFR